MQMYGMTLRGRRLTGATVTGIDIRICSNTTALSSSPSPSSTFQERHMSRASAKTIGAKGSIPGRLIAHDS